MSSNETLVIGSSGGIGTAISEELARRNHKLITVSRKVNIDTSPSDLKRHFSAESTDFETVTRLFEEMKTLGISPKSIICTIGDGGIRLTDRMSQWDSNFAVNFLAFVNIVDAAIYSFSDSLKNIVTISSIAGISPLTDPPIEYSVSKAALNHYVKIKALQLAASKICLNAIAPGNILFPSSSWDRRMQANPQLVEKYIQSNVPLNRFGTPNDIATVACMLTEDNSFITGQIIVVDGGQTL